MHFSHLSFFIHHWRFFLRVSFTAALCGAGCIVPADNEVTPLRFTLANKGDTLSPYDALTIVFTDALSDSSLVNFDLTPATYSFFTTRNELRDTFTIVFTQPLSGDTRYSIRTTLPVHSESGSSVTPETDSLIFFTCPREKEPNGSAVTADTLRSYRYGSTEAIDDTDCFLLLEPARAAYCTTVESRALLFINRPGTPYSESFETSKRDTLFFSDTTTFPLVVTVCSGQKSSGGSYRIGTVNR